MQGTGRHGTAARRRAGTSHGNAGEYRENRELCKPVGTDSKVSLGISHRVFRLPRALCEQHSGSHFFFFFIRASQSGMQVASESRKAAQ